MWDRIIVAFNTFQRHVAYNCCLRAAEIDVSLSLTIRPRMSQCLLRLATLLMSHMHTNAADSAGSSPEIYFPVLHSENVAYMLLQNLIWACQHVSRRKPISNEDEQLINELIETKLLYWYQALRLLASSETGNRCLWSLSWSQCYGQLGPREPKSRFHGESNVLFKCFRLTMVRSEVCNSWC